MRISVAVMTLSLMFVLGTTRPHTQETDEAAWRGFLAWAATVPPATFVGEGKKPAPVNAVDLYRAKLLNDGLSPARVDSILELLRKRIQGFGTPEWSRLVYNNNYAPGVVKVYTEQPNALVAEIARGRTPGTALDVAMGQGR